MYKVIDALRKLEERWNEQKSSKGANFEKEDHPINLNIGKIEGGDWASSVPAWCQVDCRIAIYPGRTADDAAKEIERHVAECASADPFLQKSEPVVVWNGFFAEGFEMNVDNEAVECLAQAHERVTGKELQTFMTAGYLDARVHVLYDRVPTLCYGPVSQNIHAFDERVSLSSLKRVTATMAHFIARWCGVEKISGQT